MNLKKQAEINTTRQALLGIETNKREAPDKRRISRDARMTLEGLRAESPHAADLLREAKDVLAAWSGY